MKHMKPKYVFKKDNKYIKDVLKQIEFIMKRNDADAWREIEECYCELSAVCAQMEQFARENNIAKEGK